MPHIRLTPAITWKDKIRFHKINRETGNRLRQQMIDEETEEAVSAEDTIMGYEFEKGSYVTVEKDEIDELKIENSETVSDAVEWNSVKAAALECRQRLADMGPESFVKTTGGKGLHVVIPITRHHEWPEVKAFASALSSTMAADNHIYITKMTKSARRGRIFIDYLRNDRTATAVAPYSTRARPGAPIALPINWSEMRNLPSGNHFTMATIDKRLSAKRADPWAEMTQIKQRLTAKAKKAVGLG